MMKKRAALSLLLVIGVAVRWAGASDFTEPCHDMDDVVYTADVCSTADHVACNHYCTSDTCSSYCSDECSSGAGAICAFQLFSGIQNLCAGYSDLVATGAVSVPPRAERDAKLAALRESNAPLLDLQRKLKIGDDTSAGCDEHAYCEFCVNSPECVDTLQRIGALVLDDSTFEWFYDSAGAAPMALTLLGYLDEVCDIVVEEHEEGLVSGGEDDSITFTSLMQQAVKKGAASGIKGATGISLTVVGVGLALVALFVNSRRMESRAQGYTAIEQQEEEGAQEEHSA